MFSTTPKSKPTKTTPPQPSRTSSLPFFDHPSTLLYTEMFFSPLEGDTIYTSHNSFFPPAQESSSPEPDQQQEKFEPYRDSDSSTPTDEGYSEGSEADISDTYASDADVPDFFDLQTTTTQPKHIPARYNHSSTIGNPTSPTNEKFSSPFVTDVEGQTYTATTLALPSSDLKILLPHIREGKPQRPLWRRLLHPRALETALLLFLLLNAIVFSVLFFVLWVRVYGAEGAAGAAKGRMRMDMGMGGGEN
ncbi:hypothetical protein K402DRAFT_424542 [Aulographum hederae CBS 113979]|uniref:Uncharacterized protein n=1 Tax=Aulographum hederae CBS 113979 TaxID=1176131 RepID=A0A6G1GNP5_9PEZI|nr:hypothetical protein K402DRAFT_424542 [Aulographum hederae CBS 113979]